MYALKSAELLPGFEHGLPISKLWFCFSVCVINGAFTSFSYYFGASRLEHAYNVLQKENPEKWKCQPKRKLTPKLHDEAVRWSLVNSFLAGFVGTAIFMRHLNTGNLLKVYVVVVVGGAWDGWDGTLICCADFLSLIVLRVLLSLNPPHTHLTTLTGTTM